MARRAEAKKGGSSRIFELLYFQNRKEFAADFFCVFILPIDEQRVWIWAKSEGVTCQLFWKVVHLAWNDPNKILSVCYVIDDPCIEPQVSSQKC